MEVLWYKYHGEVKRCPTRGNLVTSVEYTVLLKQRSQQRRINWEVSRYSRRYNWAWMPFVFGRTRQSVRTFSSTNTSTDRQYWMRLNGMVRIIGRRVDRIAGRAVIPGVVLFDTDWFPRQGVPTNFHMPGAEADVHRACSRYQSATRSRATKWPDHSTTGFSAERLMMII